MNGLAPADVLKQVASALPDSCKKHIVIIGSLAAGYSFFADDDTKAVRTKDVDCVLEPFDTAVRNAEVIAQSLLNAGWTRRVAGDNTNPGTTSTRDDQLPAVRLYPPATDQNSPDAWFIELLTVPTSEAQAGRSWTRIHLSDGDFGLPSFRFLSIATYGAPLAGNLGIRHARPELMALANLLEHPKIKPDTIRGSSYLGRELKRSNKDLGRVLAIARLSKRDDFRPWLATWLPALKHCFPTLWASIAASAGSGLRQLLRSEEDFDEAYDTCVSGLLSSAAATKAQLRAVAERLLVDAIEPLEEHARDKKSG